MSETQNIIKAALAMAGVLAVIGLIVGMTLRHHIGGFIRTVEREAREQAEAVEAELGKQRGREPAEAEKAPLRDGEGPDSFGPAPRSGDGLP